jgi:uncharacterized DUF497 family protein
MIPRPLVHRLVWDDWNRDHIVKHGVTPAEAEEVVRKEAIFRESFKNRLMVTGLTTAGRMLTVIIGPVPHQLAVFYVFSARPASRRERGEYRQQRGDSTS